jgi:hypothetical protein
VVTYSNGTAQGSGALTLAPDQWSGPVPLAAGLYELTVTEAGGPVVLRADISVLPDWHNTFRIERNGDEWNVAVDDGGPME